MRRHFVEGVAAHEGVVGRHGVAVAALVEVIFAEVAVDAVLVAAPAVAGKVVLATASGAAEIGETQADDAEGILHALVFDLVLGLREVVSRGDLGVEQGDEPVQGLLVKFLLVEGPAQFIQGQLVKGGTDADIHDGPVGVLGVEVFPVYEEVFGASELHLVEITGLGEVADEPVHDLHGLFDPPQLLVGAGHLVEHLVVALVLRIFSEQLLVERDGLERPRLFQVHPGPSKLRPHPLPCRRRADSPAARFSKSPRTRPASEPAPTRLPGVADGLADRAVAAAAAGSGRAMPLPEPWPRGCRCRRERRTRSRPSGRPGDEWPREPGGIRAFPSENADSPPSPFEPALDRLFLDLDFLVAQLGNRSPVVDRRTGHENDGNAKMKSRLSLIDRPPSAPGPWRRGHSCPPGRSGP